MNQRQLILQRRETWRLYHIPGQSHYKTLKINSFQMAANNTDEHEHAKMAVCLQLKRYGHQFITEAAKNQKDVDGLERRVDVVDLDLGVEYEIETTSLRAERFHGKDVEVVLIEGMTVEQAIEYAKKQVIE